MLAALYKLTKNIFSCVLLHASSNALGDLFAESTLADPVNIKLIVIYLVMIIASIIIGTIVEKKNNMLIG